MWQDDLSRLSSDGDIRPTFHKAIYGLPSNAHAKRLYDRQAASELLESCLQVARQILVQLDVHGAAVSFHTFSRDSSAA